MNSMKKKAAAAVLCVTALMLAAGCGKTAEGNAKNKAGKGASEAAAESAAVKAPTVFAVNTVKVNKGNMDAYLEFGGDVNAASSVDILPDTSGKLSSLYVAVGDTVAKDQVIALIDPSRPGMTYSASPVKAPISGTITALPYSIGSMAAPSLSLGKVSSTSKLEINMSVAERFVSQIELRQQAFLKFDAYPAETFKARVVRRSPVLDTGTRTMSVTLELDPPDSRIKVGMYARIKLITDQRKNVLTVPYNAVVTRAGESYVFVAEQSAEQNASGGASGAAGGEVNGGADSTGGDVGSATAAAAVSLKVRMQKVTTGIRVDDKTEILSGLTAGDIIVVKGQTLLEDGTFIRIISGPSPADGSVTNSSVSSSSVSNGGGSK